MLDYWEEPDTLIAFVHFYATAKLAGKLGAAWLDKEFFIDAHSAEYLFLGRKPSTTNEAAHKHNVSLFGPQSKYDSVRGSTTADIWYRRKSWARACPLSKLLVVRSHYDGDWEQEDRLEDLQLAIAVLGKRGLDHGLEIIVEHSLVETS